MVYANQGANYNAIAASSAAADSATFIDFMLDEISKALQRHAIARVPNKSEVTVLKLLNDNSTLTRGQLVEQTGLSDNGVKKILTTLKSNHWIQRQGSNKSGAWIVLLDIDRITTG